jgi:hypothetical protein
MSEALRQRTGETVSAGYVPKCEHWILGDIRVLEGDASITRYERAILVTFKSIQDYRAALEFVDPLLNGSTPSNDGSK